MDDYEQSRAAFAVVAQRWTEELEALTPPDLHQLSDAQLDELRLKFQAAFDEMLTFLDQGEHFGEEGQMELLVDVTDQLENLRTAGHACAQLLEKRQRAG